MRKKKKKQPDVEIVIINLQRVERILDVLMLLKEAVVAHKIAPYEVFDGEDELLEEMLTDIRETCGEIIEDDDRRSSEDH